MSDAPLTRRKPVQLVATTVGGVIALIALCDDGTIWRYDGGWKSMPAIPQMKVPT